MYTQIDCVVGGKVQGVGFRDFAQRTALERGLVGWVKNGVDGSVAVCVQGMPDELKDFVALLNEGSPLAHVESVSVGWSTPTKLFDDFVVIHY